MACAKPERVRPAGRRVARRGGWGAWRLRRRGRADAGPSRVEMPRIALVGSPNVGKSALFSALSGRYATVSNYPGTTVELTRGTMSLAGRVVEVVDTPGMYSFCPITEEERVGRAVLTGAGLRLVVHVVDAKNLERMLPLTLQLIEAGLPVVLAVNMIDEAERAGLQVDTGLLARRLGIPVAATAATTGRGMEELRASMAAAFASGAPGAVQEACPSGPAPGREGASETASSPAACARCNLLSGPCAMASQAGGAAGAGKQLRWEYPAALERALADTAAGADHALRTLRISRRSAALLLLRGDADVSRLVASDAAGGDAAARAREHLAVGLSDPVEYVVAVSLKAESRRVLQGVVRTGAARGAFGEALSRAMMRPLTGLPIMFLALYAGLYKFVGGFGAGTVVDFLDRRVFGEAINPFVVRLADAWLPWTPLRELVAGEFGVITMGLRYALAIVLPIVAFFFVAFAVVEDSGYLPRLAMLVDRTLKRIGLSGRAVIPLVLGLGCDTMATMVTRTLPTKRERLIATLLLSLAVPCSAQLGLMLAMLHGRPAAALLWVAVIGVVFLIVGRLSARFMPGEPPSFYMEIPPLRWPAPANVAAKTAARVMWYLKEVIPVFALASACIWLAQQTGALDAAVSVVGRAVRLVGLPSDVASVFVFGFFRRDYGAADLYDMSRHGVLSGNQMLVACVTLTLFLPCIAQFVVNVRERGLGAGLGISAFVLACAFAVAFVLNAALMAVGVRL